MANRKNKNWSKEIIVQEIQRLHLEGVPLYSHYMRKTYQELLAAGMRHFGGWKEAVLEAGFSYDEVRRYHQWSNEKIIETIQSLYRAGVDLSFRAVMLSKEAPMVYAAIRTQHFGSWRNALELAGLPAEEIYRYRSWDDQEILNEIRTLHSKGEDLSSKRMDDSSNTLIATARRRFGTWEKAVSDAGLDYSTIRRRQRWSRELILEQMRPLVAANPKMNGSEMKIANPALFAAICKHRFFGGWPKAMSALRRLDSKRSQRQSNLTVSPSVPLEAELV